MTTREQNKPELDQLLTRIVELLDDQEEQHTEFIVIAVDYGHCKSYGISRKPEGRRNIRGN